jgi:hypothetical protein
MWKRAYADGEKSDGLVYPAERRHVNCLTTDRTLRADTGRVLTGTRVDNRVDENLLLIGKLPRLRTQSGSHLDGVLVAEQMDDLKRVCDDADGQYLLAVVAALHHQAESN